MTQFTSPQDLLTKLSDHLRKQQISSFTHTVSSRDKSVIMKIDDSSPFVFPSFMNFFNPALGKLREMGMRSVQLISPAWQGQNGHSAQRLDITCLLDEYKAFEDFMMNPANSKLSEHIKSAASSNRVPPQIFIIGRDKERVFVMVGGACTSGCNQLGSTLQDVGKGLHHVYKRIPKYTILPNSR